MNTYREAVLQRLRDILGRTPDSVRPPYLYLDPETVEHLYHELTGLAARPALRFVYGEDQPSPEAEIRLDGSGAPVPDQALMEAMWPLLRERIPAIESVDEADRAAFGFALVRGVMQSTRFPDGNLNLEITFAGIRGLLFYRPGCFAGIMQPLIGHDRFHSVMNEVEALVYVHGPVRQTIFYHQSYGDNREHDWAPLAPAVVADRGGGEGEAGLS